VRVFLVYKNERKRLTIRVASLLSKTNMNEKNLKRALRVFLNQKNTIFETGKPRFKFFSFAKILKRGHKACNARFESFEYTKMNEKDLKRALESFIKDKHEGKRLETRVASLL
jgi:hypothetical protein